MERRRGMRSAVYDEGLGAEAFRFTGMARPFPAHFHEGYVFGLVERGLRTVSCGGRTLEAGPGTVLVFHPGESHSCRGEGALDYRGLFLPAETLARWTGDARPPRFADNGFAERALAEAFAALHRRMMARAPEAAREEARLAFLARLLPHRRDAEEAPGRAEVARALAYMAGHLAESVRTEDLCRAAGLSRSALLRAFVREKGLTPYRALEALRIERARRLLAAGASPAEAAARTGFADQSHFTKYFTRLTGLAPGLYGALFREGARRG